MIQIQIIIFFKAKNKVAKKRNKSNELNGDCQGLTS